MRRELHVAVPRIDRPRQTAQRDTVNPGISKGNRLYLDGIPIDLDLGRCKQAALEGQNGIAVAARPFGKQNQSVARRKAIRKFAHLLTSIPGLALDKDGSLQGGLGVFALHFLKLLEI